MSKNIGTLSSIAALLLGSSIVLAHDIALDGDIEIPDGSAGYVNVGGSALRTGGGECMKLGGFSDENLVNACEGIEEEVVAEVAPEPEPAPAPEPVKKEPIVTTATLGGEALFANNSADLNEASEESLSGLVAQLEKFQEISAIAVVGHTDSSGAAEYNQDLSERRAASVEAFLVAAYPNVAVTSSGMGEDSPIATNSTREGRQLNRRVEIQVTAKSITE